MSTLQKCHLHCSQNRHPPILLPHNVEIILGRCPETQITEKRCSKNQLSFVADLNNLTVKVKQLGPNLSVMNDVILGQNQERVASHGDTVHFLLGSFKHTLLFDPAPLNPPEEHISAQKRPSDCSELSRSKRNRVDSDFSGCEKAISIQQTTSPCLSNKWENIDNGRLLHFQAKGLKSSTKIAAYDIDGTLIITKSGKVFPQNKDDWKIQWPEVPRKLKMLYNDGYKIVMFTNQAGISRGKTSAPEIKKKIECIVDELGVPAQAFVATGDSIYRKPAPGMWDFLLSEGNAGVDVDTSTSFFCGDAAGRPDNWTVKKKKDFSCSDRLFAKNLGLKFFTPEEHFLDYKSPPFNLPDFDPSTLSSLPLVEPSTSKITADEQELLLMVGFPGSGKSFVSKTYLVPEGYIHINRDTLGTWQKCVSAATTSLEKGKSVVVDNTNPDPESRLRFIDIAKKCRVPCRCAVMNSSITLSRHNNKFRDLIGENHEPVSEMVINSFKSKFKEPQLSEGFDEIFKVNVVPKFSNPSHERLFKMYLLDKH